MLSLALIAIPLPRAFPPIVNPEISPVTITVTGKSGTDNISASDIDMTAPIEPLTIPAISPITSLQKFETAAAFAVHQMAVFAPLTFFAAIELNVDGLEVVTATPIISKITPVAIKRNNIIIATQILSSEVTVSETTDSNADIVKETKNIRIIQNIFLFFFLFFWDVLL